MKKILPALLSLLLFSINSSAQMHWYKTYGSANKSQLFNQMIPLSNGGYLLVGDQAVIGANNSSAFAIKTNANGDTVWTHKHLTSGLAHCMFREAAEDADGNLILVGEGFNPIGTGIDLSGIIVKLQPNGDTIWTRKTITLQQNDAYNNVIIGNDGSYIISGVEAGFNIVKKISKSGALQWSNSYSFAPTNSGRIVNLSRTQNGYLVFMGSNGGFPFLGKVIKTNETGIAQSSNFNFAEVIWDVTQKTNGNQIACGYGSIYEFNASGDTLWSKKLNKSGQYVDPFGIKPTPDGNYIAVCGRHNGFDFDVGLMKIAANGLTIKDTILIKLGSDESSEDITVDVNGDYVFAGDAVVGGTYQFFLAKFAKWNQVLSLTEEKELASTIKLYPNPARERTTIESEKLLTGTFNLLNLQGQNLWQETVANSTKKVIPLENLPDGVYILRFAGEDGAQFNRKLLKK
jgi:hypothetical protein